MQTDKENLIVGLSYEFAKSIVEENEFLYENKKFVISNQLLKSGTSVGANIRETQRASRILSINLNWQRKKQTKRNIG